MQKNTNLIGYLNSKVNQIAKFMPSDDDVNVSIASFLLNSIKCKTQEISSKICKCFADRKIFHEEQRTIFDVQITDIKRRYAKRDLGKVRLVKWLLVITFIKYKYLT